MTGLFIAADRPALSLTGLFLLSVLCLKVIFSIAHREKEVTRRQQRQLHGLHVTLILPFYNEDDGFLAECLTGIANQIRPPDRLHIVNDGSTRGHDLVMAALPQLRSLMDVEYTVFEANRGKRAALAEAFAFSDTDVFMTTDSDTILDTRAIAEGLKPFSDPTVAAVTGRVGAANRTRNLLTRFTDLRYAGAFLHERSALSVFGSVLVCCGAVALYRADVIRRHTGDFLNQRFLGQPVRIGDDRRLTNFALLHGKVVFQPGALASTAVPERLSHYVRQQVRWTRSFLQESVWIIRTFPLTHRVFWFCLVDLGAWVIFTGLVFAFIFLMPLKMLTTFFASYLTFTLLLAYARGMRFLEIKSEGQTFVGQLMLLLLSPVFGVLHTIFFTPLRLYSLLTLRKMRWNTRGRGAEVARPAAKAPAA